MRRVRAISPQTNPEKLPVAAEDSSFFLFRHGEPPSRRILILNTIQILNMTFHFNEN